MKLFFLVSAHVFPAIFYFIFCFLLQRYSHEEFESVSPRHLIAPKAVDTNHFTLVFVIIAASLLSDLVYLVVLDRTAESYLQSISVHKVYMFSSLLPLIMMKYVFNLFKYARYLYVSVMVFAVGVFFINHQSLMLHGMAYSPLFARMTMLVCVQVIVVLMFFYIYRQEGLQDVVLWKMSRSLRLYGVYFISITMVFIFYCLLPQGFWDYLLALLAFVAIHALMVYNKVGKDSHVYNNVPYPIPEEGNLEDMPVFEDDETLEFDVKYKSVVEPLSVDQVKAKIVEYLEVEKGFLRHDINLENMAQEIGTNKTYLSYVINKDMNKKFRDLIKYYRVKEAIRIFNENPQISYKDLSRMCGFNNFASFSGAFKLYTGMPPGEWCRSSKKNIYLSNKKSKN